MPEEVGGGGLDYLSQALIERELSKVSWALHVFVGVGHGEDDGEIGMPGVADEMLAAVENEVVAFTHGAGLDRIGIGTGTRLGQGEAVDFFSPWMHGNR